LKSRRQGLEDEYDIVLYNHASVAIIEVKYKAHTKDIPIVLKKAETFRLLFPELSEHLMEFHKNMIDLMKPFRINFGILPYLVPN